MVGTQVQIILIATGQLKPMVRGHAYIASQNSRVKTAVLDENLMRNAMDIYLNAMETYPQECTSCGQSGGPDKVAAAGKAGVDLGLVAPEFKSWGEGAIPSPFGTFGVCGEPFQTADSLILQKQKGEMIE